MDLRLFWGVVKRYKRIAIGGLVLAVVLAILTYGTPGLSHGKPTIIPRGSVTWEARAQLLIAQSGGAYEGTDPKKLSVTGYMASLSGVYAAIANGDAVQDAARDPKVRGQVSAQEGVDPLTGEYQPLITLTSSAPTPTAAVILARRGVSALQNYVAQTQAAAGIPTGSRIVLEVLQAGNVPVIASGHKPTVPILVLIGVLSATIMLLFSLENRDPETAAALGRVPANGVAPTLRLTDTPGVGVAARSGEGPEHLKRSSRTIEQRARTLDRIIKPGS